MRHIDLVIAGTNCIYKLKIFSLEVLKDEKEIEEAFERGEFKRVKNFEQEKKRLEKIACYTLLLIRNKKHPSVLHRFATGNL